MNTAALEKKVHTVVAGDTVEKILAANPDAGVTCKQLAKFNWGIESTPDVNRMLLETVGVKKLDIINAFNTELEPGTGIQAKVRIPKPLAKDGLEQKKKHLVTLKKPLTAAPNVGIVKLDRWFIPEKENCEFRYTVKTEAAVADKLVMEVWGSNYCKATKFNNGWGEFSPLPDVPVYIRGADKLSAESKIYNMADWKGEADAKEGMLKGAGRFINAAFSPYTVHLRLYKDKADEKARVILKAFWPKFDFEKNPPELKTDSLKIEWEFKDAARLKAGELAIVDKDENVVFRKPLAPGDLSAGAKSFTWDGKYNWDHTATAKPAGTPKKASWADMPYRVKISARTAPGDDKGVALAAMHTEVRLYVDPGTKHVEKKDYDLSAEPISMELALAEFHYEDTDPARDNSAGLKQRKWMQWLLAKGGYNPGPVDGADRPSFKRALQAFQRAVPKRRAGGTGDFTRLPSDGSINADVLNAVEDLTAEKLKWFGTSDAAGKSEAEINKAAALPLLRDPAKDLVVWVDDREYYDTSDDATINGHAATLGNVRGKMSIGDGKATKDAANIPRPWIPLVAELPLVPKAKKLDEVLDQAGRAAAVSKKAVGPIRVDWTFDETDPDYDVVNAYAYNKTYIRSKSYVKWALEKYQQKDYERKEVKRKATFTNCRSDFGGVRPTSAATYYKSVFGNYPDNLSPFPTFADDATECIATMAHDDWGDTGVQKAEELRKKAIGLSGIYFQPSTIAGDGYRLRARVRFAKINAYDFPNLEVLAARYPKLPVANTGKLRVWRRTTLRGYIGWCAASGNWPGLAGGGSFPRHYRAANVHVAHENDTPTTPNSWALGDALYPTGASAGQKSTVNNGLMDLIVGKVAQNFLKDKTKMKIDGSYVWPWYDQPSRGWTDPAPVGVTPASDIYDSWFNKNTGVLAPWRAYREALLFELVKGVETRKGVLRGHLMVEFDSTPGVWFEEYECSRCAHKRLYMEKTSAGGDAVGRPCPKPGGCGGAPAGTMKRIATAWTGHYRCNGGCGSTWNWPGDNNTGTARVGQACPGGGACGTGTLVKNAAPTGTNFQTHDLGYSAGGLPLPAVGSVVGATWLFTSGEDVVWTHEAGHHRHLEHAAVAPGAVAAQHDVTRNPHFDAKHNTAVAAVDSDGTLSAGEKTTKKNALATQAGWDIHCIMNGYGDPHDNQSRSIDFYCGKCILKNRGWKVQTITDAPAGNVKDA